MSESTCKKDYCSRCMSSSLTHKDDGQIVCNNCGKGIVTLIRKRG
jgi:transcription initiation factor TFIIIB Brf1 subunit/transcription initiation factor TFIIB